MWIPLLAALHVATVVLWIGGVGFVTVIIFPLIARMTDSFEAVMLFQGVEHRFARHAKIYVALTGITGFLLLYFTRLWYLMFTWQGLGITLMFIAWFFYLLVLIFEKRIFKKLFSSPEKFDQKKVFAILGIFHWVVLGISMLAVFVGVWWAHAG